MDIKKIDYSNFSIIVITDPVDIGKISIDNLKNKVPFDFISYATKEVLLLGSTEKKIKVTLQSNRFEFVDENRVPFNDREFDYLKDIFDNLTATLSIKAFGINIFENIVLDGIEDAGSFIADKFLKNKTAIEKDINYPVFSHTVRMFFGEINSHFDLRLFPIELQKEKVGVHFHYHNDISIADVEKLIQKIEEAKKMTVEKLPEFLNKILEV